METTPLEQMVMYSVIKASKAYLRALGARLAAIGLHPGQDVLLHQLWETDGLPQSELIDRLGVEPPTVAKALARLEKAGWVLRRRDPHDARVWRVYLTPTGEELEEPVREIWAAVEAQGTEGLAPEERHLLRRLAFAVSENIS